jgi:AbrB family looped-hinge helix DNA binding protein
MKTLVTTVTERGQVSIPAEVRKQMGLRPGRRLLWEPTSDTECRVRVSREGRAPGAVAMLGYARHFREPRRTSEWLAELREGER